MLDTLSALASIATAAAVMVAAWQLVLLKKQEITIFEDSLAKEYRDIAATLPVEALLGEEISESEHNPVLFMRALKVTHFRQLDDPLTVFGLGGTIFGSVFTLSA